MRSRGKRIVAAVCAASICAMLGVGCVRKVRPAAQTQVEIIELPGREATPTQEPLDFPYPSPNGAATEADMTFDESGNIWFSDAMKARFAARTFSFDHAPRVLIYHTHAREAFRAPDAEATPAPTGTPTARPAAPPAGNASPILTPEPIASLQPSNAEKTRSDDPEKTVVHLGDLLATALTERGFEVYHNRTDVEAPELSSAYARSAELIADYEGIDLYIDLHRNAANADKARDDVVWIDGKRAARMFFVVGTGINAETDANALKNWENNYTLALSLYEQLAAIDARLVKENRVKQGYYNQQAGLCLLAEIGHNANLMTDAEHTIPLFADALSAVCRWERAEDGARGSS